MGYQALLFCTDDKTVRVVTQVLNDLEFSVELSGEPFAAVKRLTLQHFDAVVVDCDDEQNAALLFKSARNSGPNHSALAVALVQGQAGIARAFRIGANLVLTKPINVEQSKGTLRVARGLLRKADAAKSAAVATSPDPPTTSVAAELDIPSSPAVEVPAAEAVPPPSAPKTSLPVGPMASASLEVEKEPTPEPDAAEAALLDSMPAPVPTRAPQPAASSSPKRYPWQSVVKQSPEPFSAPVKAAVEGPEAAGYLPTSANPAEITEKGGSLPGSHFPGTSAATAPAPAKETSGKLLHTPEPGTPELEEAAREVETPAIQKATKHGSQMERTSSATSTSDEEEPGLAWSTTTREPKVRGKSGSRGAVIAVLVVVAMAAAGYYAWPQLGPTLMNLPIVQKYLNSGQPQPPSPAPTSVVTPPPAQEAMEPAADSDETAASSDQPSATAPEVIEVSPQQAEKPDAGIPSSTTQPAPDAPSAPTSTAPAQQAVKTEAPLIVKGETRSVRPGPQHVEEVAPPSVGSSSESTDKAIAKIVGTSSATSKPLFHPLRISQGVSQGLLVKQVRPAYPIAARQMRVQGPVQLEATISKEGNISDVKVLSGNPMLTGAAVEAVRRWKYKPYYLNGTPIEIQTDITINFRLP
jgi:protein TonB